MIEKLILHCIVNLLRAINI